MNGRAAAWAWTSGCGRRCSKNRSTTIRALWRGESVTVDGRWRLHKSRIAPLPPEPIEVWIGASAKVAIDRAARLGDAWLADPGMDFETARRRMDEYREACERYDRKPATIAIRRDTYVGASADEARKTMARYLRSGYRGFSEDALLIGDVDQVAQRMAELGAMGYTDVIIRNISADQAEALATIERLARVQRAGRRDLTGRRRHALARSGAAIARDRADRPGLYTRPLRSRTFRRTRGDRPYDARRTRRTFPSTRLLACTCRSAATRRRRSTYAPACSTPMAACCWFRRQVTVAGHCRAAGRTSRRAQDSPANVRCSKSPATGSARSNSQLIKDRSLHPYMPRQLEHIYKLLFVCELTGGPRPQRASKRRPARFFRARCAAGVVCQPDARRRPAAFVGTPMQSIVTVLFRLSGSQRRSGRGAVRHLRVKRLSSSNPEAIACASTFSSIGTYAESRTS